MEYNQNNHSRLQSRIAVYYFGRSATSPFEIITNEDGNDEDIKLP